MFAVFLEFDYFGSEYLRQIVNVSQHADIHEPKWLANYKYMVVA